MIVLFTSVLSLGQPLLAAIVPLPFHLAGWARVRIRDAKGAKFESQAPHLPHPNLGPPSLQYSIFTPLPTQIFPFFPLLAMKQGRG